MVNLLIAARKSAMSRSSKFLDADLRNSARQRLAKQRFASRPWVDHSTAAARHNEATLRTFELVRRTHVHRARSDTRASARIDDALERRVVITVRQCSRKIGERVLDLRALEKAQTPVNPVGHTARSSTPLQTPAIGHWICTVRRPRCASIAADLPSRLMRLNDKLGFVAFIERTVDLESDRPFAPSVHRLLTKSGRCCAR